MARGSSIKDLLKQIIIHALMHNFISPYRVPETITTDRDSQYPSKEWKDFIIFLGDRHIHTIAYHPQSNGLAEQTIQKTKIFTSHAQ